jgi:hypothetical protein
VAIYRWQLIISAPRWPPWPIPPAKHLRVLERAGLISQGREAQWRPRRLEAAPLKEVAEWAESYRRFWDASHDRLDEYLRHLKAQEGDHGHGK